MNKKEYCKANPAAAYISAFGGVEIHGIIYGIDDSVIFTAGSWTAAKSYHKSRIYYNRGGDPFFIYRGNRLYLSEAIRNS